MLSGRSSPQKLGEAFLVAPSIETFACNAIYEFGSHFERLPPPMQSLPEGYRAVVIGSSGWHWFSVRGVTEFRSEKAEK